MLLPPPQPSPSLPTSICTYLKHGDLTQELFTEESAFLSPSFSQHSQACLLHSELVPPFVLQARQITQNIALLFSGISSFPSLGMQRQRGSRPYAHSISCVSMTTSPASLDVSAERSCDTGLCAERDKLAITVSFIPP